jgi:hypothetical protein
VDAAIYNLEPDRLVNPLGQRMVDPGIGCHLDAAVAARPILGCREEL